MKRNLSKTIVLLLLILGVSFSEASFARGRWFWGGAGLVTGAIIGAELSRPYYYPYPPQTVIVQEPVVVAAQPGVVVQQTPPPQQNLMNKPGIWYFCSSQNKYYPHISNCPEGWKEVPATPPPGN